MAMQFNKIFLGDTPSDQRRYLTAVLRFLRERYPRIVLPAVGQFTLAKCAIEAGYAREAIFASDISLYTSLLGYLYAGKSVDALKPMLAEEYRERYKACADDTERVACLFWLMKTQQLNPEVTYERLVLDDLAERREEHIAQLSGKIATLSRYYAGINYDIADMRALLSSPQDPGTVVVVNPPVYKSGYSKMFDFKSAIRWESGIDEFDFSKEYRALYERTRAFPTPFIWYRFRDTEGFDGREVIFCKEYDVNKRDYWLMTKPEELAGFRYRYTVDFMTETGVKPYPAPVFSDTRELTTGSRIRFVPVDERTALYYRDLWAHKLGNTSAEQYFLMLVDGKVFATVGFMTTALFRLESDRVFENYGFSAPVKGMPRANRLLMMAITSREFGDVIRRHASRVNRIYRLNGLRTTCLSKYRKVKLNNGILDVLSCERIRDGKPNGGMYKILYDTDFHDMTFAQVVAKFLDEEKALQK